MIFKTGDRIILRDVGARGVVLDVWDQSKYFSEFSMHNSLYPYLIKVDLINPFNGDNMVIAASRDGLDLDIEPNNMLKEIL